MDFFRKGIPGLKDNAAKGSRVHGGQGYKEEPWLGSARINVQALTDKISKIINGLKILNSNNVMHYGYLGYDEGSIILDKFMEEFLW